MPKNETAPQTTEPESTAELLARLGTDAMLWAEEIASRKLTSADDLLGWCANMMQAAADAAQVNAHPATPVAAPDPTGDPDTFTVRLKPLHADYIRRRAAAHGEQPGDHIAAIVRAYWASHDEWKRQNSGGASRPGTAAVAP